MPIQGEVKVLNPGKKRRKEPKIEQGKKTDEDQSSNLFVIKDSKYHDNMFNLGSKKSN